MGLRPGETSFEIRRIIVAPLNEDCGPDDPTNPNVFNVGAAIQMRGANQLDFNSEIVTAALRGEGVEKENIAYLDKMTGTFSACFTKEAEAVIMGARLAENPGGTSVAYGSGSKSCDRQFPYFVLGFETCIRGVWQLTYFLKAKIVSKSESHSAQNFATFNYGFEAIPTEAEFTYNDDQGASVTESLIWARDCNDTDSGLSFPVFL